MQCSTSIKKSPLLRLSAAVGLVTLLSVSAANGEDNKPSHVHGKVTTPDGKPAANLTVKISPNAAAQGSNGPGSGSQSGKRSKGFEIPSFRQLFAPPPPLKTTTTDANGVYDLGAIPPNLYKLAVGELKSGGVVVIVDVPGDGSDLVKDVTLRAAR